jgi:hypothetical protein
MTITTAGYIDSTERIDVCTNQLRWRRIDGGTPRLQQLWVNQKKTYLDWQGADRKEEWRDVPEHHEFPERDFP